MYEKCVAWISSTDCLAMTSMYQLLHPDWRKFPHRLQYGWTQDHKDLLQILHQQILNGEVCSAYYSSDSEYEMASKKHMLHFQRPFLGKPELEQQETPEGKEDVAGEVAGVVDDEVDADADADVDVEIQYHVDDEYDVHPPDIAYTEREIDAMCLSSSRRSSQSSAESLSSTSYGREDSDPDNDFLVYSFDPDTDQMRVFTYRVTYLDRNRNYAHGDVEFGSWVVLF